MSLIVELSQGSSVNDTGICTHIVPSTDDKS